MSSGQGLSVTPCLERCVLECREFDVCIIILA